MKISFDIDNIKFLKISYLRNGQLEVMKFAFEEKNENTFTAVTQRMDLSNISTPQEIGIDFICHDGLYKTKTELMSVRNDEEHTSFVIHNPATLNYQENRILYRVLAKHDCIYTVETEDGMKSFDVYSHDISPCAISIISQEMIVSRTEMSLLIMLPQHNIRTHLKFLRCELHDEGYKLAFEFTDISEKDASILSELCVKKQLNSN